MKNIFTGERLETFIFNANAIKHLHRYALASKFINGKVVLDIASGEGYGSSLMSNHASCVYGVDISKNAIKKAKSKYRKKNINFLVGSTSDIPLDDNSIDVVVSYETLEHHDEHFKMLEEIRRVLRPDGICIISTPDKHFYSDVRDYRNEFHVKELYKSEFINLVNRYFSNCQILTQSYLNGNSIILDDFNRKIMNTYTGDYSCIKKIDSSPQFMIAIISDNAFNKENNSIFDGTPILKNNTDYQREIDRVYNSNSYKLGHLILSPFKLLKKFKLIPIIL